MEYYNKINQNYEPGLNSPLVQNSEELNGESSFMMYATETLDRIKQLVEYYLSDENLCKDTFLLKHVTKHYEGYISLKLISNYKKIKCLAKDWKHVRTALQNSTSLVLNSDGTKVKRIEPISMELQGFTRPFKTILAYDIPQEKSAIDNLTDMFGSFGIINSIQIQRPGGRALQEIQHVQKNKPELINSICALVEYENIANANDALKSLENNGSEIKVIEIHRKFSKMSSSEDLYDSSGEYEKSRFPCKTNKKPLMLRLQTQYPERNDRDKMPFYAHKQLKHVHSLGFINYDRPRTPEATENTQHFVFPSNRIQRPQSLSELCDSVNNRLVSSNLCNSNRSINSLDSPCSSSPSSPSSTFSSSPWMRRRFNSLTGNNSCPNSPLASPFLKRRNTRLDINSSLPLPDNVIRFPKGPDGTRGFLNK